MTDPVFFVPSRRYTAAEVANLTGAVLADSGHSQVVIDTLAPASEGGEGALVFVEGKRNFALMRALKAAAIICPPEAADMAPAEVAVLVHSSALAASVDETWHIIERTGQFLTRFAVGREDKCQLGGPVKIAGMAGQAAKLGFEWLVQLVALLSVGIGILNLLPIPPLDGGHLVFYAAEAVIRRPVSERVMEAVYRTGMILVLAFMAFVFWNDLFGC